MSTETLPGGLFVPGGGVGGEPRMGMSIIAFLIASVALHLAFAWGLYAFGPARSWLAGHVDERTDSPLIVDVVELPPGVPDKTVPKKKPTHYADRTQSVEKETWPEEAPPAPPAPRTVLIRPEPASPKSIGKGEEGIEGAREGREPVLIKPGSTKPGQERAPGTPAHTVEAAPPPKPNLFLTEEKITQLTKRYEAEAPKHERGKTLQLNTSELRYQKYLVNMKHRIEFFWEYPVVAGQRGWAGRLKIDFSIFKDGSIGDVRLVKSSNYPVLDDAAITALRLSAPFPPFPDNFDVKRINIHGRFTYDIYDAPRVPSGP